MGAFGNIHPGNRVGHALTASEYTWHTQNKATTLINRYCTLQHSVAKN